MNLTEAEIKEIESVKSPAVKKLLEEYRTFFDDPARIFYRELVLMSNHLATEMEYARTSGKQILGNNKDDKIFERIRTLLVDSPKIFEGIKKGKSDATGVEETVTKKSKNGQVFI